jgi:hypothetical protein
LSQALPEGRFPPALEAAVMRGLSRDLARRQSTVTELAREIAAGASGTAAPSGSGFMGAFRKLMGGKKEQ